MYTDDEKLKTFYSECRDYYVYKQRITNLKDRLKVLANHYENVHSPVLERISTGTGDIKKDKVITYLEAKTRLNERIDANEKMMAWIHSCIDAIPLPAYKTLVWQTCIQGYTLTAMATKYKVSQRHISDTRTKCLLKVLTDARMQEHDALETALIEAETYGLREKFLSDEIDK